MLTLAAGNEIQFYTSKNLKDWQLSGKFGSDEGSHGGVWECPDLFEMRVNDKLEKKWILLVSIGNGAINGGSGTQYFIGSFDGKTFKNDNPKGTILWLDYGTDNYAGVTWSNVDKHLFLGWMSNWQYAQTVPTTTWRSAMTIPRELSLQNTIEGVRLFSKPVKEVELLRKTNTAITIKKNTTYSFSLGELIADFDIDKTSADDFGIEFFNAANEKIKVGFKKSSNQFYIDRTNAGESTFSKTFPAIHYAPRLSKDKKLSMHIFIDHASVELFADNGSVTMTDIFFPNEKLNTFQLYPLNDSPLLSGQFYELKSIWH